jgi:hypothetical protein
MSLEDTAVAAPPSVPPAGPNNPAPIIPPRPMINTLEGNKPAPPPPAPEAPNIGNGLAGAAEAAPLSVPQAQPAKPQVPVAHRIADAIIHTFAGSNGTAGEALRSALAGGLAGVAAAQHEHAQGILGGAGVGATAVVQERQKANQEAAQLKMQQDKAQLEKTRNQYLNAETQAHTIADQKTADKLDMEATERRETSGKAAAAAYGAHRTAIGQDLTAEEIYPEAGEGGKYDHTAVTGFVTGHKDIIENGQTHQVPTWTLYPRAAEDVTVTPELSTVLKQGGYNYAPGTKINGDLLDNISTKALAAQTSADLIRSAANKAKLDEQATEAALTKKSDLTAVNPYLGAHPDDPIKALGDLSKQVDPKGQLTPAAQAAQRLLSGYDPKELETHRHNVEEEGIKKEENRIKALTTGAFTGDPNAKTPAAFLASLPAASQSLVTMIGTGKYPIDRLGYLISKKPDLLEAVAQAFPDIDVSKIGAYPQLYKEYTGGKIAASINSGSTALRHLARLKQINDESPTEVRIPGTSANKEYNNLLDTVADELVTFYQEPKTNETIASKKSTLGGLANRDAAIVEQAKAMGAKFDEYEQQWAAGAPSKEYQAKIPNIGSAASKQARAQLDPAYAQLHPEYGQNKGPVLPPPPTGHTRMNVPGKGPMDIPNENVEAAKKNGATPVQ